MAKRRAYKPIYVKLVCETCNETRIKEETDVCGPRYCNRCSGIIEEYDATEEEFLKQEVDERYEGKNER